MLRFFADAIWLVDDKKWLFFNPVDFYYLVERFKILRNITPVCMYPVIPGKTNGK